MKTATNHLRFCGHRWCFAYRRWDRRARKRAATNFKLRWAEMEDRHHLNVDTYEERKAHAARIFRSGGLLPKATVHQGAVPAFHVRTIEPFSRDDRAGRSAQGPVRAEDRRSATTDRTECASDSQVQTGRVCGFVLFPHALSTPQARRGHLSACAGHRPDASTVGICRKHPDVRPDRGRFEGQKESSRGLQVHVRETGSVRIAE